MVGFFHADKLKDVTAYFGYGHVSSSKYLSLSNRRKFSLTLIQFKTIHRNNVAKNTKEPRLGGMPLESRSIGMLNSTVRRELVSSVLYLSTIVICLLELQSFPSLLFPDCCPHAALA